MVFSDTTNKDGIIQTIEGLLGMDDAEISGNATLLKKITGYANNWYRDVDSWIWEAHSDWDFDDSNHTDLPITTTTLVNNQADYEIPSTARTIVKVEVLNSAGDYQELTPFDEAEIKGLSEWNSTDSMPKYYRLSGTQIFLKPEPATSSVTLAKGLKIWFTRDISEFASTDTTKEPGFDNHFHKIIPLGASYDYALAYLSHDKTKIYELKNQIISAKNSLNQFYAGRHPSVKPQIKRKRIRII